MKKQRNDATETTGKKMEIEVEDIEILRRDKWKIAGADPNYHYIFAADDPHRIQELLFMGAEIDPGTKEEETNPFFAKKTPDSLPPCPPGHVRMRMPKELYLKREKARAMLAKANERDVTEAVRDYERMLQRKGLLDATKRQLQGRGVGSAVTLKTESDEDVEKSLEF